MTHDEFFHSISPLFPGADSVTQVVALAGLCAILLTPAERFAPAHAQPLLWRKGFWLDAFYWFCTPLLTRCFTGAILAVILILAAACIGFENIPKDFLIKGFGPVSRQPLWL